MQTVVVTFDGCDYKVPSSDGREAPTYFTDSRADARDTAAAMWVVPIRVVFRTVAEHPVAPGL
jgi:hypothetical protein